MAVEVEMRLDDYRRLAVAGAQAAIAALAELGVRAVVTGSLARGRFGMHSDVDLLVTFCPRHLKYAIEGSVEDALHGMPFDVVYLDELPSWKAVRFTEGAIDASELR
jgi:predicted nucleotidyltransferase